MAQKVLAENQQNSKQPKDRSRRPYSLAWLTLLRFLGTPSCKSLSHLGAVTPIVTVNVGC